MDHLMPSLDDVLLRTTADDFRRYVADNPEQRKFMIYSDYCIGDKKKANDVVSFTVMPYDNFPDSEKALIKSLAPKDIKNTTTIAPSFIEYLNERRLFHISFVLKSRKGITHDPVLEQRQIVTARLENTIKMIQGWTPPRPHYAEIVKKLENVKREMSKKSANFRLFRDISLVPLLAAYIAFLLTKEAKAEMVGWFSDRDSMVEALDSVALDFFGLNHHALCLRAKIYSEPTKLSVGVQRNETGGVWYDEQNRLPDHIAGTLADWNFQKSAMKGKFVQMLENVFADNRYCVVINLDFGTDVFTCSRLIISKNPGINNVNS